MPANRVGRANQGFASLTPERRKEIASMGGKAAQAAGYAHRWTKEEASAAGRKPRRKRQQQEE